MFFKGLKILSLMQRWGSKREMMGDDPPYLAVGTEVSAKYKGAFCEAKVRKIVRSVKCKIAYKLGLGTAVVTDDQIKGTLRAGSVVEVKHGDKKEYVEATIIKIQDCSQYTVVFDDGDITTLRRTALCLKSGRHFAESETLDQLPLTHPEHFGNPVIGGRRGRRNRHDDSSDDEESLKKGKQPKEEKEADIGKVVCVEISEKKKQKDNWFPGLVVAPTAQDTVKINVKEDYLVRSFKDGRYYTVPKKEATAFTREIGQKVDNNTLRTAVDKALLFLDRDELPPHWDRELLFGLNEVTDTDSDAAFDSDTSDDEPREEKDHFVAQLYKFMDDRGTPINKGPTINGRDVDLYKLFKVVHKLGGYNRVTNHNQWKTVSHKLGFGQNHTSVNLVKHAYKKFLHSFEDFYRKLGCTMVNHPRGHRARHRSNRSLIRDKDKALPSKEKQCEKDIDELKGEIIELQKEKETTKEEPKPKEIISEPPKPIRESRKESHRPKNEKVEKKDDIKLITPVSKISESAGTSKSLKDEKIKVDDREERIKTRDMIRLDSKDDSKVDRENPKAIKELKAEEGQRPVKSTRREVKENKKDEKDKDDDKNKIIVEREFRLKKSCVSNSSEIQHTSEESKAKKSRSLFSKITGSKRIKPVSDDKIPCTHKPLGLNSVRQKRTFTERMKAMVKKFKMKTGGKPLRHKSPQIIDVKEPEEKKKQVTEENIKVIVPQLTRSKSKEEVISKVRKTEGTIEKKSTPSTSSRSVISEKKEIHIKKRKDEDKAASNDETLDLLPNYKSVSIGDKLKVYYGPTHESKVTYEAKVLNEKEENNETLYLVHYTGWNTRYDEWIKRSRIADNLSWTPGRAKRTRHQQIQSCQRRLHKRSKSGEVNVPRSTTPSSVTSSSSRTKSPAVSGGPRSIRSRARARRASGHTHTDFSESEADEDYESDDVDVTRHPGSKDISNDPRLSSDEKEQKDAKELLLDRMRSRTYRRRGESMCEIEEPSTSETENKSKKGKEESEEEGGQIERTRSRSEKKKSEEVAKSSEEIKKDPFEVCRSDRLRNKRKGTEEKVEVVDEKENNQDVKAEEGRIEKDLEDNLKEDPKQSSAHIEKTDNKSKYNDLKRKQKRKIDDSFVAEENKNKEANERRRSKRVTPKKDDDISCKNDSEQPKGREFDLNQIRLELKGISSTGKCSLDDVTLSDKVCEDKQIIAINLAEESSSKKLPISALEDVYEFKEPEPFEFEVISKCGEEKNGKIQRRTFGRTCDDSISLTSTSVNKRINRLKTESPVLTENRKISKKSNSNLDSDDISPGSIEIKKEEEVEHRKNNLDSATLFEKIEDRSDLEKVKEVSSKNVSSDISDDVFQTVSLFSDLPEEENSVGANEDSGDRLIISEPETDSESQSPLFSHQQRDHEDLFPTSITRSSSVENSQNKSPFSGFIDITKEDKDSTEKDIVQIKKELDDEVEDDPIISAIQRVQRTFSQSSGNEDSNDIDLLTELPDPTHKKDDFIPDMKDDFGSECSKHSNYSQNIENIDGQTSQSNHSLESDDDVHNPDETSSCKVIQEIDLESDVSQSSHVTPRKLLEDEEKIDKTEISITKEKSEKNEESLVLENNCEGENNDKDEDLEDMSDCGLETEGLCEESVEEENDETEEKESEDENGLKEEIIEDSQTSEASEINNIPKEDTEQTIEEEVEVDEEVILEEIEGKKYSEAYNEDDEQGRESEDEVERSNEQESNNMVEVKGDAIEIEESGNNLESLLCEETIPGSPAPSSAMQVENPQPTSPELPFASAASPHPVIYKAPSTSSVLPPPPPPPPLPLPSPQNVNEAAPVMENTPPTTPESSLSPISNSPRCERSGLSPVPENESSKSNRDSSEVDMEGYPVATKVGHYSEEDTDYGVVNTGACTKKAEGPEDIEPHGIKRRRRSLKRPEENMKRVKLSHRSPRHSNVASESDDDISENSLDLLSIHSRSPRPSKYNFYVQLDPELDASQRIAVLQQKLAELRKTYLSVKAELACIDRRRKKLRRREREASVKTSIKSEVPCS